ncbi:phosphatidate cytidylyltransferase [Ectothiorhodospiraceae bacterium WFHF3C12]|nr:phosphatidate cytidylyltransferase [Ectothiorhodospiraceae bacterium WFHF3C12]
MLKLRVITALVLVPLALLLVWALPAQALGIGVALVLLLGAWEWTRLIHLDGVVARIGFVLGVAAVIGLEWLYLALSLAPVPLLLLALAWWCIAFLWLQRFGRRPETPPPPMTGRVTAGLLLCALPWYAVMMIQSREADGPFWVTFLFILVWGADTGAYFAGKAFGNRRLAPTISPGKTWEGVLGGALLGIGLVAVYAWAGAALGFGPAAPAWLGLLLMAMAGVGFSVAGDLFESMIKRQHGVKDSGGLLPGHGGVLDRVDGMIATAPVVALGVYSGL